MGYGDDIMATGIARGAKARGKRIAFGDGRRIIWGQFSPIIFKNNPNIAPPGSERDHDVEWVAYYKGRRGYHLGMTAENWIYNYEFRAIPGELFFDQPLKPRQSHLIIVEPNLVEHKSVTPNKRWPVDRYQQVTANLIKAGFTVGQLIYPEARYRLTGVREITTATFRDGLAVIAQARLFIGPEGGLHHGAAALGTPAVVLFGGYTPTQLTGYEIHRNLDGGAKACGSLKRCQHCVDAMDRISVDEVMQAAQDLLA